MEIILAIVVASAVIFFGALISMGNERQRKAIDSLREQVVNWAVQDLKIKREHLARTVQVSDPLGWFNNVAKKISGYDLRLQFLESLDKPQGLMFGSENGTTKLIFSPLSPADLQKIKMIKNNRLVQLSDHNPLWSMQKNTEVHELSALNGGILFDLELPIAWKKLGGQEIWQSNRLWMYIFLS